MAVLSESEGEHLDQNVPSLWEQFMESVRRYPENIALICTHQPFDLFQDGNPAVNGDGHTTSEYLRWTYQILARNIDRLVQGLTRMGVQKGTLLFTLLQNRAEFVLCYWAAIRIGCCFVPLNPRNLKNEDEVRHIFQIAMSTTSLNQVTAVVEDANMANQVLSLDLPVRPEMVVVSQEANYGISKPFAHLLAAPPESEMPRMDEKDSSFKSGDHNILFTSGSTSMPKGCAVRFPGDVMYLASRKNFDDITSGDLCCITVPNNHGIGHLWLSLSHCNGAGVVYPGPHFVAETMLNALWSERCTHTALVPTMLYPLSKAKASQARDIHPLKSIFLGGTTITKSVVEQVVEVFGPCGIEIGYGTTEGATVYSGRQELFQLMKDDQVCVGNVMPGSKVRICEPNTTQTVPRGVPGELHYTGPKLVDGYIGQISADFYTGDDGKTWYKTGDQAVLDPDGRIFITGRYKEIIIRGGENVSPAAIEALLSRTTDLSELNIQIVGTSDPISGEVPVAIVDGELKTSTTKRIQETILARMGPAYLPDQVLSLQILGLEEYPRTMGGKIQKKELASVVRRFRHDQEVAAKTRGESSLAESIEDIWSKAIGYDVDKDQNIADFADSITVMKVRDRISKQTGLDVSMADLVEAGTINRQIRLLDDQSKGLRKYEAAKTRQGPPVVNDIFHLTADPSLFDSTKSFIVENMQRHGFSWDDVEDVFPSYGFVQTLTRSKIIETWRLRMLFVTSGKTVQQTRRALEETLANNPLVASFLYWNTPAFKSDVALHVTVRHTSKLFNACITEIGKVKTLDQVKTLRFDNTHSVGSGLLSHAYIAEVEETNSAAIIFFVSHAVMDGTYSQLFLEDLDQALAGSTVDQHVPYQIWAESYFALRTSFEAAVATNWHVRRLQGIAQHRLALFPDPEVTSRQRPPEVAEIGYDAGERFDCRYSFKVPEVRALRRAHPTITAPVIVKTALALMNVQRTGQSLALFANVEAGRSRFPFVPKGLDMMSRQGFVASDVAGQTIQVVTNKIEIDRREAVLSLLHRMSGDQANLTRHASAPLDTVIEQLGMDDGPMILDVLRAQLFNWVPGMGATEGRNPYSNLEVIPRIMRPDIGLACNAGLGGGESDTVFLQLKSRAFSLDEMRTVAADIEKITRWISTTEHWDSPIEQLDDSLRGSSMQTL